MSPGPLVPQPPPDQPACLEEDPELFYPRGAEGSHSYYGQVARAKEVCRRCPALEWCAWFTWSSAISIRNGIIAGTTTTERRELMRKHHVAVWSDRARPTGDIPAAVQDTVRVARRRFESPLPPLPGGKSYVA